MTIRQVLILNAAVLTATVLAPIGYSPAVATLLGTAVYGLYAVLKRLNTRIPARAIAIGTFLLSFAAWAEFIRRNDLSA